METRGRSNGVPIDRCGIGFGGPVDFARQQVALSTHVGGWQEFPLSRYVQDLLGVPTVMDNDANAGALGEARYGLSGPLPLFYMTLSTGIGGGIILADGSVYRGADSWAGEIGHLTIQPDGPECLCGARGCLERLCSGLWLERDYGCSARELFQDTAFAERYVVHLAQGLKAAIMLLNPARVVIGGGIAKAGDALFVPLRAELGRQVTQWSGARLEVVPAQFGRRQRLVGCAGSGGSYCLGLLEQAIESGARVIGVARSWGIGGRAHSGGRRSRGIARHGNTRLEQRTVVSLIFHYYTYWYRLDALEACGRLEVSTLLAAVQRRVALGTFDRKIGARRKRGRAVEAPCRRYRLHQPRQARAGNIDRRSWALRPRPLVTPGVMVAYLKNHGQIPGNRFVCTFGRRP